MRHLENHPLRITEAGFSLEFSTEGQQLLEYGPPIFEPNESFDVTLSFTCKGHNINCATDSCPGASLAIKLHELTEDTIIDIDNHNPSAISYFTTGPAPPGSSALQCERITVSASIIPSWRRWMGYTFKFESSNMFITKPGFYILNFEASLNGTFVISGGRQICVIRLPAGLGCRD
jgi:hypothetical protein